MTIFVESERGSSVWWLYEPRSLLKTDFLQLGWTEANFIAIFIARTLEEMEAYAWIRLPQPGQQ